MKLRMRWNLWLTACLLAAVGACLSGCSIRGNTGTGNGDGRTLYLITLNEKGPYWKPLIDSAKQRAQERGVRLVVKSGQPGDSSRPQKLIEMVQEAIDQKADGIAMAALEPEMFDVKAAEAMEAGIKVVTYDTDIRTNSNRLSYIGTNNYEAGKRLGQQGALDLKDRGITQGKLTTVTYSGSAQNMVERYRGLQDGFDEAMGEDAGHFTWCQWIINDLSVSRAREQLETQIMSYPDLRAVFTLGTESVITGTMEAIRSQKREGILYHYGFDYSPTLAAGVDEGLITGIVDQNSKAIGSLLVDKLSDAVNGQEINKEYPVDVTWIKAEDLKEYGKNQER
ncbi:MULTISPECIES: sugar ABC transporter substrate-binding protein [unclassified Clostridium]|jgi:ribose transport system substrate-binding protein|uniref:sugar ABC transporter substrate-binding protein n=1 Tax=unclassified Clostridium TaxID=2614128 RepID=UPI001107255A|nr:MULTISPECIES: sugar ABC transporter substrate-binding protein [unclassified Clostridium]